MEQKIATSIEQSKKLLELGLSSDTADMYYDISSDGYYEINIIQDSGYIHSQFRKNEDYNDCWCLPSWSLSALLELIPHENLYGFELNNYGDAKVWTGIFQWKIWDQHPIRIADNPLDAVFEIVCWLLENGFIKKD